MLFFQEYIYPFLICPILVCNHQTLNLDLYGKIWLLRHHCPCYFLALLSHQ